MTRVRPRRQEKPLDELTLRFVNRRFSHLTPKYLLDLAGVLAFEFAHSDAPWLTQRAVEILTTALRPMDSGLEYGSGRSTVWFAKRTKRLTSVETDPRWYARVQHQLSQAGLGDRVDYHCIPADDQIPEDPYRSAYLAVAEELPRHSLDYVLVDGLYRDDCAVRATALIKPGGLLIVDNINMFVPSRSRSPLSVRQVDTPAWGQFLGLVADWRLIWTSSGVTDTAIWVRCL